MPPRAREWVPRGAQNPAQIGPEILLRPAGGLLLPPRRQLPCLQPPAPEPLSVPSLPGMAAGRPAPPLSPQEGQLPGFPLAAPVLSHPFSSLVTVWTLSANDCGSTGMLNPHRGVGFVSGLWKASYQAPMPFPQTFTEGLLGARPCVGRSGGSGVRISPRPKDVGGHLVMKQCMVNVISAV